MRKNLTELVFILDMSGSMYPLTEDTIGGFNSMLQEQKKISGDALVTTVLFNTKSIMLHDRQPLSDVENMTAEDYHACGCTALVDAIGSTVQHIGNVHKYIREEDVPERTLFVITTDGAENSSSMYTASEVKKMVECRKEQGWEFIFLGANIDATETAAFFGIDRGSAVCYNSDSLGTMLEFSAVSKACTAVRSGKRPGRKWKQELEEDYRNRRTE